MALPITEQSAAPPDSRWLQWYPGVLLSLWVLVPELRRLVDWQVGYNSLSIVNLLPEIALLPLIPICLRRDRLPLSREFMMIASLWSIAFGYPLIVGWLSGSLLAALYDLSMFILPLFVGFWLATMEPAQARRVWDRFVRSALWLAVIASVYGIYQFISPTPWDVAWVLNSGLGSIGIPEPFQLRVFGPMNSPATLADFLALAILLTLQRLTIRSVWITLGLLACFAALALTFVRAAWIEVALGIVIFVCLSPRRLTVSALTCAVAVVLVGFASNLALITGNPASNALLQTRVATLSELQSDDSAAARQNIASVVLRQAVSEPLGQGLGSAGTSTKLSAAASTTVVDNGYLTRFLEMGFFGFAFFLITLASTFVLSCGWLRAAFLSGDPELIKLLVTTVTIQLVLIVAEIFGDHHLSLVAIIFWGVVGVSSTVQWQTHRSLNFEHTLNRARPKPAG